MDPRDLQLLNELQRQFPLCARPYDALAECLHRDAEGIRERVSKLRAEGTVRRLGPVFSSRRLGFRGLLAAAKVAPDAIDAVADVLADDAKVTHNYLRAGTFNVWFTVLYAPGDDPAATLDRVRRCPGVESVLTFPSGRVFKLHTAFAVPHAGAGIGQGPKVKGQKNSSASSASPAALDDVDRRIVAALQSGLSNSPTPWADAAEEADIAEEELLGRVGEMRETGVVRSIRAVLDQRRLGLAGNVLVAWNVGSERMEEVGRLFAARDEVTHCVERPPAPTWPYDLYTMTHAGSEPACDVLVERMSREAHVADFVKLPTLRELKKTAPIYFAGE